MISLLRRDTLLLEQFAYIVVVQMDGRHHDMAGFLSLQLDDALAKVGLYYLDAVSLQIGVHLTFLSQHRLRLHHLLHVVLLQDAVDNLVELCSVLCPVNDAAILLSIRSELVEILVKMGNRMSLDL